VVPMFALMLLPILTFVGLGVDYSRAYAIKAATQAAMDAALLAGAKDGTTNWATVAQNTFNANTSNLNATFSSATFSLDENRAYLGTVTGTVQTSLLKTSGILGALGINTLDVFASGTVTVKSTSGAYYCVMALNKTAQAALQLTGNASITINAPKCVVQVNSKDLDAVDMVGNAYIKSVDNCFVGGLRKVGNATIAPAPETSCPQIPDPFAAYTRPAVGGCTFNNYKASGNTTITLQPGVYCGGMSFSGPVNVTFSPGLYIVKDGTITESGGSFTGNGVTFFLTGSGAGIQLSGKANWHIVAPATGAMPGFAIFLDPSGPTGNAATSSSLSGQSELYWEGIVYLPGQQVTVSGTAEAFAPSPYTSYIADTLSFVGNGELVINNDTTLTKLPIPTALYVQSGGQVSISK